MYTKIHSHKYIEQYPLITAESTITVLLRLHAVQCTPHALHCTLHTAHRTITLHRAHCTMCTLNYTPFRYTPECTLITADGTAVVHCHGNLLSPSGYLCSRRGGDMKKFHRFMVSRVSKSHGLTDVRPRQQFLQICMRKKKCILIYFTVKKKIVLHIWCAL